MAEDLKQLGDDVARTAMNELDWEQDDALTFAELLELEGELVATQAHKLKMYWLQWQYDRWLRTKAYRYGGTA